jgi:hypothetical protein
VSTATAMAAGYTAIAAVSCIIIGTLAANEYGRYDKSDYITAAIIGGIAGALWPLSAVVCSVAFVIYLVREKVAPCE